MELVVVLTATLAAVSCSSLQFTAIPRTVTPPDTSSTIRSSQIALLNTNILGLSAQPVSSFPVTTDLFSAPRALALVLVNGIDQLPLSGKKYNVDVDGFDQATLDESLAQVFGGNCETVIVNENGVTGSALAQKVSEATIDDSQIKTKFPSVRAELEQVYKLIATLKGQAAKFASSNSPDIFRVSISGLRGLSGSEDEINTAIKDIQNAVSQLTAVLIKVYGDQAVVEVVCVSDVIQPSTNYSVHHIVKRDANDPLNTVLREMYNVSVFTSVDYPAIFAIFLGLSIVLTVAVLFIAVGIWNMDPGRDSIIYRMTTTRMKKD